jgi:hypothetical protein
MSFRRTAALTLALLACASPAAAQNGAHSTGATPRVLAIRRADRR